jgi:outer membrane lipoprotein-sorting protein
MIRLLIALLFLYPSIQYAQIPSGSEILRKVDENMNAETRILTSKMVIQGRRGSRTITAKSYIKGEDKAYTEYLSPAREQGTKMLKLGDFLWTYSPATDRTIQIAGHLLRQSVMGSDLSYEDLMEDSKLQDSYEATVVAEEDIDTRPCWVLELVAKTSDVAYHRRKVWVDRDRYIPLREERFAKSGKLLKTTDVKSVKRVGDRWIGEEVVFKDVLKKGAGTVFYIESVEFDKPISDYMFSKAILRK